MTLLIDDPDFRLYVGDVREQLRELDAESVHCVVTSPPYWGLRDYGTGSWEGGDPDCDHLQPIVGKNASSGLNQPRHTDGTIAGQSNASGTRQYPAVCAKCGATRVDQQLGLEATPDLFVQAMVDVFREVRRVLRGDGTCWVNLGDSYGDGKQLAGMPWKVAFALQEDGWILRSDIVWSKPNPMPESVTDRPTKAHEYVFLLTKSPRYFFDQEAVREPHQTPESQRFRPGYYGHAGYPSIASGRPLHERYADGGRNVRSVWEIATQPYPEAHFATFPEALPERCIKAGTSERGCCPECGAPWERVVEREREYDHTTTQASHVDSPYAKQDAGGIRNGVYVKTTTTGWVPSCVCTGSDDVYHPPVPCTVLDPFMGSGTTALVARRLGRRSIGVELNESYAALCARRLQQLSLFAGVPDGE